MHRDELPPLPPGFEHANHNRARFPLDQLIPYEGKVVAWNGDATRILVSGDDYEDVERKLAAAGVDPSQVILESIHALE